MFTPELLKGLEVGNVLETAPLVPGLSQEPLVWLLDKVKRHKKKTIYHFYLSYFDTVRIGNVKLIVVGDKVTQG